MEEEECEHQLDFFILFSKLIRPQALSLGHYDKVKLTITPRPCLATFLVLIDIQTKFKKIFG